MTRYVTWEGVTWTSADLPDPTPAENEKEGDEERFRIYRLCQCDDCEGTGKIDRDQAIAIADKLGRKVTEHFKGVLIRCPSCRGEGRSLELVATATDPESVGVALVTLARESEFSECPIGLMDRPEGKTGTWLIKPWLPSPRNVSDAGRLLQSQRHQQ